MHTTIALNPAQDRCSIFKITKVKFYVKVIFFLQYSQFYIVYCYFTCSFCEELRVSACAVRNNDTWCLLQLFCFPLLFLWKKITIDQKVPWEGKPKFLAVNVREKDTRERERNLNDKICQSINQSINRSPALVFSTLFGGFSLDFDFFAVSDGDAAALQRIRSK